ncbi:MAG TPA: helix-hairpin-helix domain-containing protein [Candidatus Dormibacteraeota bacterium]|nr:helix-hairpin-helix domain-containing protein [Candidatus Dormibacteraeota bacterium]
MTNWWQIAQGARGWLYRHDWRLAMALAALIIAAAAWMAWPRDPGLTTAAAALSVDEIETARERWVVVYVSGAVVHPGVYRLQPTQRVSDAIVAAGGITENADSACLPNLAAHLRDGKEYRVPTRGQGCKGSKKARLDINTATRDQLLAVAGMDEGLADAIISYRETYGGFQRLSELKSALGVDGTLYKQLQKSLTVP